MGQVVITPQTFQPEAVQPVHHQQQPRPALVIIDPRVMPMLPADILRDKRMIVTVNQCWREARSGCGSQYHALAVAIDPQTGDIVGDDIATQTRQVLDNLSAVLEAGGAKLEQVVKTTCFLNDMDDFAAFNEVYQHYLGTTAPARSCVAVERLPKDVLVEIEALAIIEP